MRIPAAIGVAFIVGLGGWLGCSKAECEKAVDCGAEKTCFGGKCVPFPSGAPACQTDDQCKVGLRCTSAGCRYLKVTCAAAGECRKGESCTGGHCVETARECLANTDCEPSLPVCEFNRCVSQGACTDDTDCKLGESCRDARCVDAGFSCETDDDCPEGTCDDGTCVL